MLELGHPGNCTFFHHSGQLMDKLRNLNEVWKRKDADKEYHSRRISKNDIRHKTDRDQPANDNIQSFEPNPLSRQPGISGRPI
jgi:hypothetical protein